MMIIYAIVFIQGPGQYFLRPMMKEYKFEPQSQMIDVLEGATIKVEVKSTRVAYRLVPVLLVLHGCVINNVQYNIVLIT